MDTKRPKENVSGLSRREFLRTVGAGAPTISLVVGGAGAIAGTAAEAEVAGTADKFTPIELTPHFTASSRDFGTRERAWDLGGSEASRFPAPSPEPAAR